MLLKAGEKVPMPPSGKSSVVMGMSPKFMLVTLKPSTPESPTLVANPTELREMPVPERYMLLAKANSLRCTNANPGHVVEGALEAFDRSHVASGQPIGRCPRVDQQLTCTRRTCAVRVAGKRLTDGQERCKKKGCMLVHVESQIRSCQGQQASSPRTIFGRLVRRLARRCG